MAPGHIRRALEANVFLMVDRQRFLGSESFSGSGILVGTSDGEHLILTSRHVVDPSFSRDEAKPLDPTISITAFLHDGTSKRSYVWWVEPHGVDLALVATGSSPEDISLPENSGTPEMQIGQKVFAVGNPHELSWSYNEGVISGIRETVKGPVRLKILQTQTPINQGNSGGGLYLADGTLIGIVTWTKDKAQAEGISFAITYGDFLSLYNSSKGLGRYKRGDGFRSAPRPSLGTSDNRRMPSEWIHFLRWVRMYSTMSSVRVPGPNISSMPLSLSLSTSSSGTIPPPSISTSSIPFSLKS